MSNRHADPTAVPQTNVALGPGISYRGDLRDGALHGSGVLTAPGGTYEGEFVNNLKHGWGRFTASTQSLGGASGSALVEYEGEWYLDQPSGKCLGAVFAAPRKASGASMLEYYGGMCLNGRPHGEGRLTYKDGKVYQGEFRNGQRHGQGMLQQANSDTYEGTFADGKPDGEGRETLQHGSRIFAGTFRAGRKERGKMIFGDQQGKWYDGEWQQERPHGRGTQKQPNGDLYTGWFADGKFAGYGEFYYADTGATFRGPFQDGLPHGEGIIDIPKKNTSFPVTFQSGRLDAASAQTFRNEVTRTEEERCGPPGRKQPHASSHSDALTYDSDDSIDDRNRRMSNSTLSTSGREFAAVVPDDTYGVTSFRGSRPDQQHQTSAEVAAALVWDEAVNARRGGGEALPAGTPGTTHNFPQQAAQRKPEYVLPPDRIELALQRREAEAAEAKKQREIQQKKAEVNEAAAAAKERDAEAATKQRDADAAAAQKQRDADAAAATAKQQRDAEAVAVQKQRDAEAAVAAAANQQRDAEAAAAKKRDADAAAATAKQQRDAEAAAAAAAKKRDAEAAAATAKQQRDAEAVAAQKQRDAEAAAAAAAKKQRDAEAATAAAAKQQRDAAAAAKQQRDAEAAAAAAAKKQRDAEAAKKAQNDAALVGALSDPKEISFANGDKYDGCVGSVSKKPEGPGHYAFADGRTYDGEFHLGLRHGQGKLSQPNGDYYDGLFHEGKQHGKGHAVSMNGTRIFDGVYDNGHRVEGKMQFMDMNGKWYDGEWREEKPHGKGTQRQSNGDVYTGDFVAGRYHGQGQMDYASDHRVLRGAFDGDKPRGRCEVSYVDGKIVEMQYDPATGALLGKKVLHEPQRAAAPVAPPVPEVVAPVGPTAEEIAALGQKMVKAAKPGEVPVVSSGDTRCPTPVELQAERFQSTQVPSGALSFPAPPPFKPVPPAEYLPDETQEALNEVVRNDVETRLRGKSRMEAEADMEEETWSTVQDQLDEEEETGRPPPSAAELVLPDGFYRKYKFAENSVYTGRLCRGLREGPAKYACASFVYQGHFASDKRHGYGILKAHPQSGAQIKLYQGKWNMDKKEDALAHASLSGGDVYLGGFQNNVFHGVGRYTYADGRLYEGEYRQGQRHGKGRLQQSNGDVYEGTFAQGAMSGVCRWTTLNGTRVFVGTVKDGKKQSGRIVFHDQGGKCFDGEWAQEKPHGRGAMLLSNGDVYRGDLDQGIFHGNGIIYYLNENKSYVGSFVNGKPHGKGTLRNHTDPSLHVTGDWNNGRRVAM